MRVLVLCSLIVAAVLALDARTAATAAWCASYDNGGTNCGFSTFEQCRAAVSGVGGSCSGSDSGRSAEKPAARKLRKAEPKPKRKEPERVAPAERRVPPPVAAQPAPAPPAAVQPPAATAQQTANDFQTARALVLSGKYEAGIAAMKSLGYDDHPDVASMIGFANAKLGRLGEARAWYDRALAADPNHLSTWGYSGALYVVQGDIAKARAALDRIKSICGGAACREYQELASMIAAKTR